ncbi:patatin-like phospholipase family protein [Methylobacterium oxalidis]|uniref:patatin-like phospholipase family protein n=1 Tax=Methylobacterium oxalidis TaxID=944322 RepID=UPI003314D057
MGVDWFGRDIAQPVLEPPDELLVQSSERPLRLGLALGSGAARGWAHIGVLQALLDAGIVPGIIAGCSVGAVVGGCHAAGKLDAVEDFARSLTKRRILGLLDFQLAGAGLISGERLRLLLERDLGPLTIDDLKLRFAAVSTEIATGHEVWLTQGSLVDAIRASYALPGIFEPVVSGGRVLMDGALVNPIPVTLARALGADVVICVNLNGDPRSRGTVIPAHGCDRDPQPPVPMATGWWSRLQARRRISEALHARPAIRVKRPASILTDAFNIAQDRIARSRLAGDPPDLMISPRLAEIGLFEFHRAAETINLGQAATKKLLPEIQEVLAIHAASH